MNNLVFALIDKEIKSLEECLKYYTDSKPKTIKQWKCKLEYFKSCKQIIEGSIDLEYIDYDAFIGMGCCQGVEIEDDKD
jgi:hypothetical protein